MKLKRKKIVFIGAGNIAAAMSKALASHNSIAQIYSKSNASAKRLGLLLNCAFTNGLKKIISDADVYIIAVKDDAIAEVVAELKLKGKIVLHTSGSVDMSVLKKSTDKYGVLYPLQTFSKGSLVKKGIPFCIEASSEYVMTEIKQLVKELRGEVYEIDSAQRATLHLAAVFVNNFTNYIFTVASDILNAEKVPFDLLMPLIEETVAKINNNSPEQSQTGPARRGDEKTIKKHEKMLLGKPEYLSLYKLLTKGIKNRYAEEL